MSNALVKSEPNRTALAQAAAFDPFQRAGEDMGGTNASYLKFNGNSGEYTFGADQEELPHGTKLAVNMQTFRRGWICWKEEAVIEEVMVRVVDGEPPVKSALTDHGPYIVNDDRKDGWAEQAAVELKDIETGKDFIFKVSSVSAIRALGTLLKDYGKAYKAHPGELAIIELGSSTFMPKNKKWGKKHSPKLNVVEWANEAELLSKFGGNAEDYPEEAGDDEGEGEGAPFEGGTVAAQPAPSPAPTQAATPAQTTAPASGGGPRRRGF